MGLSIAGASGIKFLPNWILKFCKNAKLPPAELVSGIYDAVEDLISRGRRCLELRGIAPLFEATIRE